MLLHTLTNDYRCGYCTLAVCPEVVSQAPQHFSSSETQAACDGCFARQSIYSFISLDSSVSRAVHPQDRGWWMSRIDICQSEISRSTFVANSLQPTQAWGSMTHFPVLQTELSLSSDPSDWLYRPCAEIYYCQEGNIECYKGRCLCTPGYYYSVSSKTCVACELFTYTSVAFVGVFTLSLCH